MAGYTVIDARRSIPLSPGVDVTRLAAAMNPGMSSWVALKERITFTPGQTVLILGATGSAGQLAVQIAKHLGAGRVVGAGRGADKLAVVQDLGADATIDLAADPERVARELTLQAGEVDVVLDYLWGPPAESVIMPLLAGRADRARLISWIQIGAVAGPTISLASAVLRQANIHFLGSGQGSVGAAGLLSTLPTLAAEIDAGSFVIHASARPLAEVESIWNVPSTGERIVLVPAPSAS